MKVVISCAAIIVFLIACSRKEQRRVERNTLKERIDSLITTVPDFSGVVLVADKEKAIYHRAFGYVNFETKQKMDTASIFELASVSKQFTAMLIAMLREEGKLNYDDLVKLYLPALPYDGISIRNLLNHTSGLPDYQKLMDETWDKTKVAGNEEILSSLKKFHPPMHFKAGEKYEYSNTGYVLLGSIIEKVSEKKFEVLCKERIFQPLKMTSTSIRTKKEKDLISNFAIGYVYVMNKNRYVRADSFPSSNYTIWLGGRKGPGRISSTASDLLKWSQALYTEKLVKKETLNEIFSPAGLTDGSFSNYGFGWMLKSDSILGKTVFHDGDNPGYKTKIIRIIDQEKTIIILCNNAHEKFQIVVSGIEDQLRKEQ